MSPSLRTRSVATLAVALLVLFAGCLGSTQAPDAADTKEDTGSDDVSGFTPNDDNVTTGTDGNGSGGDEGDDGPSSGDDTNGTVDNGTADNGTADNGTGNGTIPEHVWPNINDATIRPGIMLYIDNKNGPDGYCTSNFVYRSPINGSIYLGMAAHCTAGVGSIVHNSPDTTYFTGASGPRIGVVVYTSWAAMGWSPGDAGVGDDVHPHDFALIQIDDAMVDQVHPATLYFGGPVAMADYDAVKANDRVIVYGNTPVRPGPGELDRLEGIVKGKSSANKDGSPGWSVRTFVPGSWQGDSGSGLMTKDGKALGALSVLSFGVPSGVEMVFSSVPHAVEYLNENGWPVELQTWEQLNSGLP